MAEVKRVVATPAALELIERLKAKHGPLMFHQSGGYSSGHRKGRLKILSI